MDHAQKQQPNQNDKKVSSKPVPIIEAPPPTDEETKLLQELRLLPSEWEQKLFTRRWLSLAMLSPIGVLFLLGLSQDIYLYLDYRQKEGIQFRLANAVQGLDVIYLSFAVMVMAVIWLYRRFLRLAPSALRGLWDNGLLSSRRETTNGTSSATKFLHRYQVALESRWRFVLLGTCMVVVGAILGNYIAQAQLSLETFLSTTYT
jgi:hypothetical protein